MDQAFLYAAHTPIVSEFDYPYTGTEGACTVTNSPDQVKVTATLWVEPNNVA